MKYVHFADVHVKCSYSHVQNSFQPHRHLMKLRIMTVSITLKVLIEFGASEMIATCRIKSQKAMKCVPFAVNVSLCEMYAYVKVNALPHMLRTHFNHVAS